MQSDRQSEIRKKKKIFYMLKFLCDSEKSDLQFQDIKNSNDSTVTEMFEIVKEFVRKDKAC